MISRVWLLVSIASACFVVRDPVAFAHESEQHLIPESGDFDDLGFQHEFNLVLQRQFGTRPRIWAQAVVIPSNDREETVSIEGADLASSQLVHCKAKKSIWIDYAKTVGIFNSDKRPQGDVKALVEKISVPIDRHVSPLDAQLATRLVRAWVALIRSTHHGRFAPNGDDGTIYHFVAIVSKYGVISGQTWSPSPASLPGQFVELAILLGKLADAAEAARPALLAKIEPALRQAERQLGL